MAYFLRKYPNGISKFEKTIKAEIDKEFGNVPFVNQYSWAYPNWSVIMLGANDHLLSFYNVVERECLFDGKKVHVAGVNNFITPVNFRGLGYGSSLICSAHDIFFNRMDKDFGLLLCADELVSFYNKYDWYKVDSCVWFEQPSGKERWPANTMLLNRNQNKVYPKEIDLCGLPW